MDVSCSRLCEKRAFRNLLAGKKTYILAPDRRLCEEPIFGFAPVLKQCKYVLVDEKKVGGRFFLE